MVRKKLREKSEKQKAQVAPSKAATLNPAALTRGQRKRLLNKTHVMAKKSDLVLKLLKNEKSAKRLSSVMDELEKDPLESQQPVEKKGINKGAMASQRKQNEAIFVEMQRYQNVITNDKMKEDPYDTVRKYLEAKVNQK
ncbi:hypothetical protein AV274_5896 [Blastocystis sp. ATCC 50177/Nand II]|uniref:Uncharacterized protein n=1 Tax=Blastocystis sp. subtype 1 (strain ATCC 50177 / NandII) TaxID=478820 RepID=A0A196S8W4_BLAHN|nr:hypothetical protein AV274_5896 [Blastocystis sp. ATCC 50177/Nand II]